MQELYEFGAKIASYVGCITIGALVSWYITKSYYEKIVDEEVESIHKYHSDRYECKENDEKEVSDPLNKYDNIITEYSYTDDNLEKNVNRYDHPKDDSKSDPYLIPMETFDDADPAYEKICLEYYTENCCLVENDELIEPDESVSLKLLERFAKRNDLIIMYVRNESIGADYEVTKIIDSWGK